MAIVNSKCLPISTIAMSIPLLLSYGFTHNQWPEGLFFAFMFFWLLLAMMSVPVLGILEIIVIVLACRKRTVSAGFALRWHVIAIITAVLAEFIWIALTGSPFPRVSPSGGNWTQTTL